MMQQDFESDAQLIQEYRDNQNFHRWSLDLSSELWRFRLTLQGLIPNPNYGRPLKTKDGEITDYREYIEVDGARMVNHQGSIAIYNKLSNHTSKVMMDTKFDDKIIGTELIAAEFDFPTWLLLRSADFELKSEDYDNICESYIILLKSALYRSVGGWKGELTNKSDIVKEHHYQDSSKEEKPKFRLFGQ